MKNFIYISDTKIDNYLPQIKQGPLANLMVKWGIKAGPISLEANTDQQLRNNRITKLNLIYNHLKRSGQIGTIEDPKEFIFGHLKMVRSDTSNQVIFMGTYGENDGFVILLNGSPKHFIGYEDDSVSKKFRRGSSVTFTIAHLIEEFEISDSSEHDKKKIITLRDYASHSFEVYNDSASDYEFLATTQNVVKDNGITFIRATPLYVALKPNI